MSWRQVPRTRIGRILFVTLLTVALLASAFVLLLAATDRGLLDRPIQRWASHRLGRAVTFKSLRAHLLSCQPRVEIEGLAIANPLRLLGGTAAEAARLTATFRLTTLLAGSLEPTTLSIDGLDLHLIRVDRDTNNWTFGTPRKGERAFAFLRSVEQLSIAPARIDYVDVPRKLRFHARLAHAASGPRPLLLTGQGTLDGVPLRLVARGGPLHGAAVDRAYPFVARIVDGATIVDARGTSGDAFDLTRFALAITARGPNLADLGYLFDLRAPNSAPYRLATTADGDGGQLLFKPLQVHFGGSDVRGWIRSDHRSARHHATATLWSALLTKDDVRALLAPLPPRRAARNRSGAVGPTRSRWILPDTPFPIANLRAIDLQAQIHVEALRGYTLPLTRLAARIALDDGTLTYSNVRAEIYGGRLSGRATLDVHRPVPKLTVTVAVDDVRLARIPGRAGSAMRGDLSLTASLSGVGRSVHETAAQASGAASVRIGPGSLPPAAAFMLGGDMLKALRSMGDVRRPIALDCVLARFAATDGRLVTNNLAVRTAAGDTTGQGVLDLKDESVHLTLTGDAKHHKPFQLAMPILVQGPIQRPRVSVLPAPNATKLGLKGDLGVAMSPFAALLPLGQQTAVVAQCH